MALSLHIDGLTSNVTKNHIKGIFRQLGCAEPLMRDSIGSGASPQHCEFPFGKAVLNFPTPRLTMEAFYKARFLIVDGVSLKISVVQLISEDAAISAKKRGRERSPTSEIHRQYCQDSRQGRHLPWSARTQHPPIRSSSSSSSSVSFSRYSDSSKSLSCSSKSFSTTSLSSLSAGRKDHLSTKNFRRSRRRSPSLSSISENSMM